MTSHVFLIQPCSVSQAVRPHSHVHSFFQAVFTVPCINTVLAFSASVQGRLTSRTIRFLDLDPIISRASTSLPIFVSLCQALNFASERFRPMKSGNESQMTLSYLVSRRHTTMKLLFGILPNCLLVLGRSVSKYILTMPMNI